MKKLVVLVAIGLILISCNQNTNPKKGAVVELPAVDQAKIGKPVVEEKYIMADFASFWTYYASNIKFFEDFVPFDTTGKVIEKSVFLEKLTTQLYYPLVINSKDSLINYKLTKIPAKAPELVGAYMRQGAAAALVHYKMEGKPIPAFNFSDINGNLYTSENTKGKIVLFKCWFIKCGACILEMPQLNRMVERYKDRDDILFISLAMDPKQPLQSFLAKTKFDYATIPNQTAFMANQLKVTAYPHHFLINKQGLLVKSVPEAGDIEMILERELKK